MEKKKNKVQESYKGTTGNSVDRLSKGNGWKDKRGTRLPCPKKKPFYSEFWVGGAWWLSIQLGSTSAALPKLTRKNISTAWHDVQMSSGVERGFVMLLNSSAASGHPNAVVFHRRKFPGGKRKPGTYFPWLIRNFSKDAVRILRCRRSWKAAAALTNESVRRRENEKGFQP